MSSYLISGTNQDLINSRVGELKKNFGITDNSPDEIVVAEETLSIGIAVIRSLKTKINFSPYKDPNKIVIIYDAEKLTIEAQNALLKILEEPPPKTYFVLIARSSHKFLPTVLSRCQIISLNDKRVDTINESDENNFHFWENLFFAKGSQKISIALSAAEESSGNKESTLNYLNIQEASLEKFLHSPASKLSPNAIAEILNNINKYRKILSSNVSPRLCLENLFLENY